MPIYTKKEEQLNILSHLFGAVLSFIGFILLVIKAHFDASAPKLAGAIIFGLTLIELYTASTVYHSTKDEKLRKFTQKFDHLSVNLAIIGGTAGYIVGGLANNTGYILFGVVLLLSLISMVLNSINVKKYRVITMACCVISGWMPIFVIHLLYSAIGNGIWLLLAGGLCYTFGLIFYGIHKEYMHSIWHIFCLLGAIIHFFGIYFYVI